MSITVQEQNPKAQVATATEVAAECPLSDEAQKLLTHGQSPNTYLGALIQRGFYNDALRFSAYKLARREAVWWGALCLWERMRPRPNSAQEAALQAIVGWVQNPGDESRRAAEAAGRKAGINSPIGILALAVYFSEGSISLPGCPDVQPDPHATAQQVAAAVVLAARMPAGDATSPEDAQRRFLVLAANVDEGKLPWSLEDA
jgi:hypothetical protein